ncbi:MAG TPA: hypothetical protein VFX31_03160, partial [Ktedonobacterales bacterium]|nr:hypothetical protein [Ktedonobacterales bacterium]
MTGSYRALRVVAVLAIVGQIGVAVLLGARLAGTEVYTASPSSHLHWFELVSYGMTPNDFLRNCFESYPAGLEHAVAR